MPEADETEYATDVMFRSSGELAELYPSLLRHSMTTFGSQQVMRFLGKTCIPKGCTTSRARYCGAKRLSMTRGTSECSARPKASNPMP